MIGGTRLYKLSEFLLSPFGNCYDMAATVQLFSNAVGVDVYIRKIAGTFTTNLIRAFARIRNGGLLNGASTM